MYRAKMMIVMRRDLKMRKGKIAAQAGHAAIEAILMALHKEGRCEDIISTSEGMCLAESGKTETPLSEWFSYGCAKICVYVDSEEELMAIAAKAEEKGVLAAVITDAGMTEFHGVPTKTCLALEPLPSDMADEITGGLPLY
jgi:PTH2 family peptidyl-tRNA hydrolase